METHIPLAMGLALVVGVAAQAQDVNPCPPVIIVGERSQRWTFDTDAAGWTALHDCTISAAGGVLKIACTGNDPYLGAKAELPGPSLMVKLRARCSTGGDGQLFWATDRSPNIAEKQSKRFALIHDGEWHEYSILLEADGTVRQLRLDPGSAAGQVELSWVEVYRGGVHPLVIESIATDPEKLTLQLKNNASNPIAFLLASQSATIEGGKTLTLTQKLEGKAPFEACTVTVEPKGMPPLRRTVVVFRPQAQEEWLTCKSDLLTLKAARDGSGALIEREGRLVAVLAPLVLRDGQIVTLKPGRSAATLLQFEGDGVSLAMGLRGDEIEVAIRSEKEVEGPVLRAVGELRQGLFAGLEYLGKGEKSSSTLDIETGDRLRFAPDVLKVTMPLMSCLTDRAAVAMTWKDMDLQPVFATPNFFDGTADHRMALRGKKIDARILVRGTGLEETILWAVERFGGLPELPKAPRDRQAQFDLALKSLNGPIKGEGGWGHCAEPKWGRQYFADIASTIWRLTGKAPEMPRIVPGGAHVPNDAIYFVTGKAQDWLNHRRAEAKGIIGAQQPDGSFRYKGQYQRGHYEDTASGFCGQRAARALEFARATGDKAALEAGVKALEYMKRFDTPRGAQTWELSLHTPDILASAHLVHAYVRGFELTGNKEYLALARKWALSGAPFVYLWGKHPTMKYATVPVYGATNFRAPLWIGLPVQWCGGVYAYALTMLAPHDKTLDWNHLARGILIAGQQMQYPDGPLIGCLPDVFELAAQRRAGPSINPGALTSLQLVLDGDLDSLAVATGDGHRVAAPFPVTVRDKKAHIRGKEGAAYQVLVDGTRIVEVQSKGQDAVDLEPAGAP